MNKIPFYCTDKQADPNRWDCPYQCEYCKNMETSDKLIQKMKAKPSVYRLEETKPVNRLSEIVGKWPGDESAEEIIEGIKGEPQTNEGVTEVDTFEELRKISFIVWNNDGFQGSVNQSREISKEIHQQFIEPLQKQVKELSYKAEAYDNVLSIFKIPEGQVIGYIKNFQDRLSSLQAENERLKKELESVKVAAKKVIDVYNGKNT